MMKNVTPINRYVYGLILLGGLFTITGCETEQSSSKNNNAMVGYVQEHAQAQAEFSNQKLLEKSVLTEVKAVTDGSSQSLNTQ